MSNSKPWWRLYRRLSEKMAQEHGFGHKADLVLREHVARGREDGFGWGTAESIAHEVASRHSTHVSVRTVQRVRTWLRRAGVMTARIGYRRWAPGMKRTPKGWGLVWYLAALGGQELVAEQVALPKRAKMRAQVAMGQPVEAWERRSPVSGQFGSMTRQPDGGSSANQGGVAPPMDRFDSDGRPLPEGDTYFVGPDGRLHLA